MERTVTAEEMLHPTVLACFGVESAGGVGHPSESLEAYGYVDITFPSTLRAAQWVQLWTEEGKTQPPVHMVVGHRLSKLTFNRPVTVTVTNPDPVPGLKAV